MAHAKMYDDADRLLQQLREICLALPEVEERVSHGRPDRDDVGWDEVAELVDASYRSIADKRQLAALDMQADDGG